MAGRGGRRTALVGAAALALVLWVAPAVADATFPALNVYTYSQSPGQATDLSLELVLVPASPAAASVAVTAPVGYSFAAVPAGSQVGPAEIDVQPAAGGTTTTLQGSIVAADPATAVPCAPGPHTGVWNVALSSATVPVAVDQLASGGSYRLTACLDALAAAGLKPVDVYLVLRGVVTNPASAGTYGWSALVTPYATTGAADPTAAWEVRGDEPLPEQLSTKAVWTAKTKRLVVTGKLLAAGAPRTSIRVHVLAGATSAYAKLKEIGVAVTGKTGAFTLTKKVAKAPGFVTAHVRFYYVIPCNAPSTAPKGCASETTDGTDSPIVKVTVQKK